MVEYCGVAGLPGYRVGGDGSVWWCRVPKSGALRADWKQLKGAVDGDTGYLRFTLRSAGRTVRRYGHQLVLEAFVGPRPAGMEACHFPDASRTNNTLANLRWDTRPRNQADRLAHGTSNRGERQGRSKLKEGDIPEIFAIRRDMPGATMEEIGHLFGVAKTTIQGVLDRRNWGWLSHPQAVGRSESDEPGAQG